MTDQKNPEPEAEYQTSVNGIDAHPNGFDPGVVMSLNLLGKAREILASRQHDNALLVVSFTEIAAGWSEELKDKLKSPIEPHEAAFMMAKLKDARLRNNPGHVDSVLDRLNYTVIAHYLHSVKLASEAKADTDLRST